MLRLKGGGIPAFAADDGEADAADDDVEDRATCQGLIFLVNGSAVLVPPDLGGVHGHGLVGNVASRCKTDKVTKGRPICHFQRIPG